MQKRTGTSTHGKDYFTRRALVPNGRVTGPSLSAVSGPTRPWPAVTVRIGAAISLFLPKASKGGKNKRGEERYEDEERCGSDALFCTSRHPSPMLDLLLAGTLPPETLDSISALSSLIPPYPCQWPLFYEDARPLPPWLFCLPKLVDSQLPKAYIARGGHS